MALGLNASQGRFRNLPKIEFGGKEGWSLIYSYHELWYQSLESKFLRGWTFGILKYISPNIIALHNFTAGPEDCLFYEAGWKILLLDGSVE